MDNLKEINKTDREDFINHIANYIRNFHSEDIISEKERITIDLEKLYNYGLVEFMEYLHNNPYDGLEILNNAYNRAYRILKSEESKCIITIKNLPDLFKRYEIEH